MVGKKSFRDLLRNGLGNRPIRNHHLYFDDGKLIHNWRSEQPVQAMLPFAAAFEHSISEGAFCLNYFGKTVLDEFFRCDGDATGLMHHYFTPKCYDYFGP